MEDGIPLDIHIYIYMCTEIDIHIHITEGHHTVVARLCGGIVLAEGLSLPYSAHTIIHAYRNHAQ